MVEIQDTKVPQENALITILGPTATGKTLRAVEIAKALNGEIISADSRQVYRGMDIGTGKDLEEYGEVAYHMIDVCEAGDKYNLYRYIKDFHNVLKEKRREGKELIICGGTGLYLETALNGIILPDVPENPELRKNLEGLSLSRLAEILRQYKTLHNTTDIDNAKRAIRAIEIEEYYKRHPLEAEISRKETAKPLKSIIIGIDIPRQIRRERITARLNKRLEQGMVEEVERLLGKGIPPEDLIYYGLEYKYLTLYITGKLPYESMVRELEIAIHQFAKRQMTWFRGMERRGFKINWLPFDMPSEEFVETVLRLRHLCGIQ